MTYDPQRHHRRSVRLPGYDYAQAGAYFVTACTYQREVLFGEIIAEQMIPSGVGQIVADVWQQMPSRFPRVTLDAFVVMPNHFHGILLFTDDAVDDACCDEVAASNAIALGKVMRAFKSLTAVSVNRLLRRTQWPLWQRSYHDHVVRDEQVLEKARRYVAHNPLRWDQDTENPLNL